MPDVPSKLEGHTPVQPSPEADLSLGWRDQLGDIRPGLWLAVVLLCVAAVYSVSLAGEFVWDDVALVAAVERTLAGGSVRKVFLQPFWSTNELDIVTRSYYRPLTILTLVFDSQIHQRNSAGFRATNLFLHLLNAALLFQLCRRLKGRVWVVALLVACWALQPRLAESVAWISGRTDVLCGTFVLAALLAWRPTWGGRALASALLLLALLAKETAIVAVLVISLLERATVDLPWRKTLLRLSLPWAAMLGYFLLRTWAMQGRAVQADSVEFLVRPRIVLEALATYTVMLLDPWQPRTQIGSVFRANQAAVVVGALLLLLFAWLLVRYRRHISQQRWPWVVLAVVPLALVSHAIPIAINVVAADRFLYLPTMAVVILALELKAWSWRYAAVLPAVLGISLVPVAWRRAADWADPIALWTKTCIHQSSRNSLALLELGNLEFEAGNFERARAIFVEAQRVQGHADFAPERSATNLALATVAFGRYREAQAIMQEVVRQRPRVPKFWYDLAVLQLQNGDFPRARGSLHESLRLMPDYSEAATVLSDLTQLQGAHMALKNERLGLLERAVVRTKLALYHEAEKDWLELLGAVQPPAESIQDQALAFLAEHGSARAVAQVLANAESFRLRRPELLLSLTDKFRAAERLERISLSTYGIQP